MGIQPIFVTDKEYAKPETKKKEETNKQKILWLMQK